jgi:UDP-2,3-diacylglucosamine hydrolase
LTHREDVEAVPHYFASDVHLRKDRPDRDRRFHAWLDRLTPEDSLVIAGDLCDFWMGARRQHENPVGCESLQTLAEFRRRGGSLAIMPGNHDEWLCPFYRDELGATIIAEPHDMTLHGLRVRVVHGHRLGARRVWKSWMETRAFFEAFSHIPETIAQTLDRILESRNLHGLKADEERHMKVFREYAALCRGTVDLVVIGHVHQPADDTFSDPRMVVLGGWQRRSSYLQIDEKGATLRIEHDHEQNQHHDKQPRQPSLAHDGGDLGNI